MDKNNFLLSGPTFDNRSIIDKFGINRAGIEIITELIKEISSLENKIKYLETELSRFKTRGVNRELLERNRRNT